MILPVWHDRGMVRLMFVFCILACGERPPPAQVLANTSPSRATDWIARLHEVSGNFHRLERDEVIVALLALGNEAVDPLIELVEFDSRTSQVVFDRERDHEKIVFVPVYRLAYWLLQRLIDTSYFVSANAELRMLRGERAKVAAELRAEWAKVGKLSRADRWYQTLADDAAGQVQWMDAATKILQFVPDPHVYDPFDVTKQLPLQGKELRTREPSVTSLLVRRIDAVAPRNACELARLLGRWEPAAAKVHAARVMQAAIGASGAMFNFDHCIWSLAVVRAKLGDDVALDEYARWIAHTDPPHDTWDRLVFQPMWVYASRPMMQQAAAILFGPGSSWLPLVPDTQTHPPASARAELLDHPMYRVPAFQSYVLGELAVKRAIGSVETNADRSWSFRLANGINASTRAPDDVAGYPGAGTHPIRVCDYYAYKAAFQHGAPRFELFWDQLRRDAALPAITNWVRAQRP